MSSSTQQRDLQTVMLCAFFISTPLLQSGGGSILTFILLTAKRRTSSSVSPSPTDKHKYCASSCLCWAVVGYSALCLWSPTPQVHYNPPCCSFPRDCFIPLGMAQCTGQHIRIHSSFSARHHSCLIVILKEVAVCAHLTSIQQCRFLLHLYTFASAFPHQYELIESLIVKVNYSH